MLIDSLSLCLKKNVHHPKLLQVMDYAVFPPGKLFRPKLVEALCLDLHGEYLENYQHLASAIELHHAYTLVHDDLPSMDNDLIRRGRPSTHAKFGEWRAILAGDALLITSFSELQNIKHKNYPLIFKLMVWCTGAKGLIEGQFRDLSISKENASICEVIRIHELKTARLIQLVTLGSYLLCEKTIFKEKIDYLRLGREIGVSFQLLDDLCELALKEVSSHETDINPFLTSPVEALGELQKSFLRLNKITSKYQLRAVHMMLEEFFKANQEFLLKNYQFLESNIPADLGEMKKWITSFV